jgi:predicted NBD/HSP70 family sugar kinase
MAGLLKHLEAHGVPLSGIDDLKRNFDPNWAGLDTWVERTLPHLNRLIFGLTGILDPEAIVFGGQIAPELAEILISRVQFPDTFRYNAPPPLPDLVAGTASENPAANGVAQLPMKHIYFR